MLEIWQSGVSDKLVQGVAYYQIDPAFTNDLPLKSKLPSTFRDRAIISGGCEPVDACTPLTSREIGLAIPLGAGAPSGLKGCPVSTMAKVSRSRSVHQSIFDHGRD